MKKIAFGDRCGCCADRGPGARAAAGSAGRRREGRGSAARLDPEGPGREDRAGRQGCAGSARPTPRLRSRRPPARRRRPAVVRDRRQGALGRPRAKPTTRPGRASRRHDMQATRARPAASRRRTAGKPGAEQRAAVGTDSKPGTSARQQRRRPQASLTTEQKAKIRTTVLTANAPRVSQRQLLDQRRHGGAAHGPLRRGACDRWSRSIRRGAATCTSCMAMTSSSSSRAR